MKVMHVRRLKPVCLLVFLFLSCAFSATSKSLGNDVQSQPAADAPFGAEDRSKWDTAAKVERLDIVNDASVQDALRTLKKIKSSDSRYPNAKKSSSTLGNLLYYTEQIFSFLFRSTLPGQDRHASKEARNSAAALQSAVKILEDAASEQHPDALFLLAEMSFYGNFTYSRNYAESFRRYKELASITGNSTAQYMLGFMYATGIGDSVKPDQAKALLYHSFAAEGGNIKSQMTVAYRLHVGISAPRNCQDSVFHYKNVADRAIRYMRSGPPGGHTMTKDSYRIADDEGGVYGEGASVSSSGLNAKQGGSYQDPNAALDDVMDYLDLMSRKGDLKATFSLGKLYYDGSRSLPRDFTEAKKYFLEVARTYWQSNGRIRSDASPGVEKLASKAAGYLGRMFLRGEGMAQSFSIAQTWFKRGIANGDSISQYSMGIMYLDGLGVTRDPVKAAEYFAPAADQDLAAAQVRLGVLFLDQGDITTASQYFDLAARNGHIEAYYYLAELANQGIGREQSCNVAAVYYKIVAEKAEAIVASFREASEAYEARDLESALVGYMMAAEEGFEVGQVNVAYLLDQSRPRFSLRSLLPFAKKNVALVGNAFLALIYWTRSAKQSNIDSMVKMGDYYLSGLGTSLDSEKAAACYQAAAETLHCAQAMWNLGWMHENGIGIEQDFHLAKRFYDLALETNPREAYLPVMLSLYKLRFRSWWNSVTHGNIKPIQDEPEPEKQRSIREWLTKFLEADLNEHNELYEPDDHDSAHDPTSHIPGSDEFYDDIDESILESLGIVVLAAALAFLIYYRQQRQMNNNNNNNNPATPAAGQNQSGQQQQRDANNNAGADIDGNRPAAENNDRGMFPAPDDPEFMNWAAGGVGH